MEHDLEQQIAQLVGQFVQVPLFDASGHLAGLFEQIGHQRFMSLLPIPGATVLRIA